MAIFSKNGNHHWLALFLRNKEILRLQTNTTEQTRFTLAYQIDVKAFIGVLAIILNIKKSEKKGTD
jgi:hypothetical protein